MQVAILARPLPSKKEWEGGTVLGLYLLNIFFRFRNKNTITPGLICIFFLVCLNQY